jgi:predicted Zn finger-like uncharacterized protein
MTSASNQMITRCPKCGTAFRVTPSQLQSAKGAVRCGSCLNVFKAQEYLVASTTTPAAPKNAGTSPSSTTVAATALKPVAAKPELSNKQTPATKPVSLKSDTEKSNQTPSIKASPVAKPLQTPATPVPATGKSATPSQPNILSAIKPLPVDIPQPAATTPPPKSVAAKVTKPVIRTINKSSLGQTDDILISDDMDDSKSEAKSYDFDGFMDINTTPKSDVSLFERKIRDKESDDTVSTTDESWAEMLMEDEEDDTPQLAVLKPKTDEQLADDELFESHAINKEQMNEAAEKPPAPAVTPAPGLVFSLVGEKEEQAAPSGNQPATDDFIISDELAQMPSNQGFKQSNTPAALDPSIFETPEESADEDSDAPKRQVKTQPKIRSYDGSRTALLMNIIPAPIEFSAKRMRRWYQRKLWPTLSILGLLALAVQVGWFKFDYFSRVEPYRTGYLFLCPYLGCQVPTLVDTSRIIASNLVVREHPDTQGALAVDVMLINGAPFEQPFPDLVLVFTDIDDNQVASRRFIPKDYLGGELVGRELMPQNQKIHITLDLVDPGAEAVNYHISIPRQ